MRRFTLLPLLAMAAPAFAQTQPGQAASDPAAAGPNAQLDEPADDSEIVVVARRLAGSVDAPQPPLVTLEQEDIATYGASSITELIEALGTQTTSSRGRGGGFPVTLINGQRVSSFREMRNIPPEAIRRVEVLPEEVALRYGYPPNQRVVNMILKDAFASKTVEVEYHRPTDGGFDMFEGEASLFRIAGKSRLNLTVNAADTSPLTEGERGVQQNSLPVAGDLNPAEVRTLIADSREFGFNGTWTTPLGMGPMAAGLTLNAAASTTRSTSFSGLVAATDSGVTRYFPYPLMRRSKTDTYQAGINLNRPLGSWRVTTTVDASTATTTTRITARPTAAPPTTPAGPLPALALGEDRARAQIDTIASLATLVGRPFSLPAGDVSLTAKLGFNYTRIASSDTRTGVGEIKLGRKDISAGINLAVPITSRRDDVLAGVGDINLNLSAGFNRLSDFGMLYDYSAGITWGVTEKLSLQASYIVNEAAPSLANLGNPEIHTFNVPIYDFALGQTALVTIVSGGNPNLLKERQRDLKISANWQVPFFQRSSLQIEYIRNNSNDVTNGFPLLTPAIEAAFPGRVVRASGGRLVSVDQRPVTFDNVKSSRLRYGFNVSGSIGKAGERSAGGLGETGHRGGVRATGGGFGGGPRRGGPGGAGPGFGPRGPGGMMGAGGQGRWNLAMFHTVRFDETVRIAPGGPVLDLLDGDALSGGGVSRHSIEVEGGAFYKGFGFRFNGAWASPTQVRSATSDLRFGSAFKIDLRAFVNLDQQPKLVKAVPFLKGSRLSLEVDNLLNARQRVTDANGVVPPAYQPDLIDPRGRMIGFEFRKQF